MRTYARIENGTVRETITLDDAADIKTMFAPGLIWIETTGLPTSPQERWLYDGSAFTPPPPPPPPEPLSAKPLTAEELAEILIARGTITQADVIAKKNAR